MSLKDFLLFLGQSDDGKEKPTVFGKLAKILDSFNSSIGTGGDSSNHTVLGKLDIILTNTKKTLELNASELKYKVLEVFIPPLNGPGKIETLTFDFGKKVKLVKFGIVSGKPLASGATVNSNTRVEITTGIDGMTKTRQVNIRVYIYDQYKRNFWGHYFTLNTLLEYELIPYLGSVGSPDGLASFKEPAVGQPSSYPTMENLYCPLVDKFIAKIDTRNIATDSYNNHSTTGQKLKYYVYYLE